MILEPFTTLILKKKQRKKMLLGDRPSECSYCWDMEDLGNQYSDRYIKSTDPWAWHAFDKVKKMDWQDNINPTYVEVMIDNLCNFSCAYCISDVSTGVAAEMKRFGEYPVSDAHHRLPLFGGTRETSQPFVAAFEKWLPKILPELKVLRVTGGEPLLSPSFWSLLEKLAAGPKTPLEFAVNTHLCHRPEVIDKFCATLKNLQADEKINSIELYVSLDTHGRKAEYIRHGLNYQVALDNLSRLFELLPETRVVIMCTFNILTFGGFDAFLDDIIRLKAKHNLVLDVSNLKNPHYLRADIGDEELTQSLSQALNKIKKNANFFNSHEIGKVENLLTWTQALTEKDVSQIAVRFLSIYP